MNCDDWKEFRHFHTSVRLTQHKHSYSILQWIRKSNASGQWKNINHPAVLVCMESENRIFVNHYWWAIAAQHKVDVSEEKWKHVESFPTKVLSNILCSPRLNILGASSEVSTLLLYGITELQIPRFSIRQSWCFSFNQKKIYLVAHRNRLLKISWSKNLKIECVFYSLILCQYHRDSKYVENT